MAQADFELTMLLKRMNFNVDPSLPFELWDHRHVPPLDPGPVRARQTPY